ncbi:uncharacterized protein LOC144946216 isoform X2 [Lampetra fluviatilis]
MRTWVRLAVELQDSSIGHRGDVWEKRDLELRKSSREETRDAVVARAGRRNPETSLSPALGESPSHGCCCCGCLEVEDDCPGDGAAVENGNAEEKGSGWSHHAPTVNEGDVEESSDSSDDEEDVEKEVRLQVCGVCWKEFPRLSCLKRHLTSHTGEKAFPCSACGKNFSSTSSLNRHRKTHEEVKPFVCTVCERQFSHLDYLRSHQRTHTKEKPYACSKCGKAFTRLTYVREHEQAHTGARPYACELCGKTFPYKTNMKIHMKKHGEKKEV